MSFTLCLNVSTIKTTPLLDKIRLTAKHGFAGVELWLNDLYEHVGQGGEVRDVEKAIADHGLIVPCCIAMRSWGEASELEYPLMLDECKRRMELAQRIGSPYIVATPPREPCDMQQIAERYKDLLNIGRHIGVTPLMEYISFFNSVRTLQDSIDAVEATGDSDAAIILDAFHTWNAGGDLDEVEAMPLEYIAHYHFDDGNPDMPRGAQMDPNRVMPGDGVIDLAAEVAVLKEKGYDGTVSLELFSRDLWAQDADEVVKLGMERMQQYFG
jgi:2-keto-myo-inositol isomerase